MASEIQSAKEVLGELFILGVQGLELQSSSADFLKNAGIGGVIFFSHNYESPAQLAELSRSVQLNRPSGALPLWISADQEGGRVQRFRQGFTKIPEAAAWAAAGSSQLIFEMSEVVAKELRAVGVNVNYAPVADINTNPKNPVIGPRAFGTDAEEVAKAVTAFVRGHVTQGVQPCVKHFPGHGDTATDSHFSLPKITAKLEQLQRRELKPFLKAFKSRCNWVMTAHILCKEIDAEFPATLSRKILQDLLRKDMRFTGLIVSDDMIMKAVTDHYGEELPVLAIEAGCDLLCYRNEGAARTAYETCLKALESGKLSSARVLESADRARKAKAEQIADLPLPEASQVGRVVGIPEHQEIFAKLGS